MKTHFNKNKALSVQQSRELYRPAIKSTQIRILLPSKILKSRTIFFVFLYLFLQSNPVARLKREPVILFKVNGSSCQITPEDTCAPTDTTPLSPGPYNDSLTRVLRHHHCACAALTRLHPDPAPITPRSSPEYALPPQCTRQPWSWLHFAPALASVRQKILKNIDKCSKTDKIFRCSYSGRESLRQRGQVNSHNTGRRCDLFVSFPCAY